MVTAFLLGYHRNRQSLCKPPLIEHIRFPGRLEYLLKDTPPVVKYKYKQILFWSGTHLCLTSYATLYVRVILNIGVTCDTGKHVRTEWFYEQDNPYTFVPRLQETAGKNTVLHSSPNLTVHCPFTFLWTWQSFSQSEALLDRSYTTGNKQARNGAKGNRNLSWMKQAESKPVRDFSTVSLLRQLLFWTSK